MIPDRSRSSKENCKFFRSINGICEEAWYNRFSFLLLNSLNGIFLLPELTPVPREAPCKKKHTMGFDCSVKAHTPVNTCRILGASLLGINEWPIKKRQVFNLFLGCAHGNFLHNGHSVPCCPPSACTSIYSLPVTLVVLVRGSVPKQQSAIPVLVPAYQKFAAQQKIC